MYMACKLWTGGPGSDRGAVCRELLQQFSGVKHLAVGATLKSMAADKHETEEAWADVRKLILEGQTVPQVIKNAKPFTL